MYDYDLHMRFLRSATDAWMNYATAGLAAFGAWQSHVTNEIANVESNAKAARPEATAATSWPTPADNPFSWWTDMFMPKPAAQAARTDFAAPFFQFAGFRPPMPAAFDPAAMFNPMTAFSAFSAFNAFAPPKGTNPWTAGWMDMMQNFSRGWPQMSWTMYHAPMTAWLMSQGLPYEVASPTARGNAASMDAADAAREGFNRMYSSFRSDGGHAATPAASPMALMLAPFWDMAKAPAAHVA